MRARRLGLAILLAVAGATPLAAGGTAPGFTVHPEPVVYEPGKPVTAPAFSLGNMRAPVSHALTDPKGDISGTFAKTCPGLSFSKETGDVSGTPTGDCALPEIRISATDADGRKVVSDPFSLLVEKR